MEELLSQSVTLGIYLYCGIPMLGFALLWLRAEYKYHRLESKFKEFRAKHKPQYA